MKYIIYFLVICCSMACNEPMNTSDQGVEYRSSDSTKGGPLNVETPPAQSIAGCYMKIIGRDTAIIMLEQKGNKFSGKMLYDNFEKDGSHGTVKGTEDKEIIKLWYDFNSEGMHSVMEVYFKKENGRLFRGIGDMDVKTDTTSFISGINYSDKEEFSKVDCNLVEWKLKF